MSSSSTTTPVDLKSNNMDSEPHQAIYEAGLEIRKKVVGEDYVEKALANQTDFSRPLQQFATVRPRQYIHSRGDSSKD